MNKSELIREVSKRAGLSLKKCENVLNESLFLISDVLSKGGSVHIANFGRFKVKTRAERRIINPQTKREMYLLPKSVPVFVCSKKFKTLSLN